MRLDARGRVSREAELSERVLDPACVRAAQRGDRGAFDTLYRAYGRMVHGILLSRVSRFHVEDLVQDVFLVAWTRISTLRDPAAFGGWLAAIARNRAVDFARGERPTEPVAEDVPAPESWHAETLSVLRALRSLPVAYRETLALRLVEGLSGPEIARMTGLTEGSVRVNLHRGIGMLRERLRNDEQV